MQKPKIFILSFLILAGTLAFAQIQKPVKWSFQVEPGKDNQATLVFSAKIDKGWHVYSQFIEGDGPIPTTFTFEKSKDYELVGKAKEGKPEEVFDQNFGVKLKFFSGKASFKQTIKLNNAAGFEVKGVVNFMVCNDNMCLPPEDVDFKFIIPAVGKSMPTEKGKEQSLLTASTPVKDTIKKDTSVSVVPAAKHQLSSSKTEPVSDAVQGLSLWSIFIGGFIGGFLALLTPCVFPMIPLTVSFFTKKDHSRVKGTYHAGIYGLSIIVIYVLLGFGVTKALGADALNALASNGIFNLIFFLLLVVFAASFLGAFEITLPNSWINKADQQSERGGLVGIFFMAATLALVSFSCTGPIIGTLLVQAASGKNTLGPLIGMTGFALALALPFAIFAAFPSMLKTLPKSGGWLNSVKVVLGFLELALALKFLSNVDLVYHLRILDREVFLVLWIVIFSLLGLYLIGKLKFSHDSTLPYITIPRLFLAITCFAFSLYMVPGLWGAPLKAISAFSPPQSTQDFDLTMLRPSSEMKGMPEKGMHKYSDLFDCPHNLNCFFDYNEGMDVAKKLNKPVFIDFTGHSCVNCRKMEVSVWSDQMVLKRFNEDYVLISLYVDDKTNLPENEQYISKFSGKKIKTLGNKWSDLQASQFGANSQPYYVILNHEGKLLTDPHAFDLSVESYCKFLDKGKAAFTNQK